MAVQAVITTILNWTFLSECSVPIDIEGFLIDGEKAIAAYKTYCDNAIFTNKRIIVREAQGLTAKKLNVNIVPYSSIVMWSTENTSKKVDCNTEAELWTNVGRIQINLKKGIDKDKFDKLMANAVL